MSTTHLPTPTISGRRDILTEAVSTQDEHIRLLQQENSRLKDEREALEERLSRLSSVIETGMAKVQSAEANCAYTEHLNRELHDEIGRLVPAHDASMARAKKAEADYVYVENLNRTLYEELNTSNARTASLQQELTRVRSKLQSRLDAISLQEEERRQALEARRETEFGRAARMREEKRRSVARVMDIGFGVVADIHAGMRKKQDREMNTLYEGVKAALLVCEQRDDEACDGLDGLGKDLEEELRMAGYDD